MERTGWQIEIRHAGTESFCQGRRYNANFSPDAACLVSGCAYLAPVRNYANETKQLSAAFAPMLSGATASCMDEFKRRKLLTTRDLDALEVESGAREFSWQIRLR